MFRVKLFDEVFPDIEEMILTGVFETFFAKSHFFIDRLFDFTE